MMNGDIKMKKNIKTFMVLILTFSILTGCGSLKKEEKSDVKSSSQLQEFKEENGLLLYTDKTNSPFENSGLAITIKKGQDGYVKFVKTDKEGNPTVDYYEFNYEKDQVEKYYYVSAMGNGFYYYYDLTSNTLTKIEDKDHNDSTQSTKESQRWDSASKKMDEEVKSLEEYFETQYHMTIKDSVLK